MDARKARLHEIASELGRLQIGGKQHNALTQEEQFINQMFILEERIAAAESELTSAKRIRASACLKVQMSSPIAISTEAAIAMIEASVEKTVEFTIKLSMLKNDRCSLISRRAAQRTSN